MTAPHPEIVLNAPLAAPSLAEIRAARSRIAGAARHTPLVRLPADDPREIYLKLEPLQPIGSFKLRGAVNAIRSLSPEQLSKGVYTTSAGNMAQGLAWAAREIGVPCRIVAPDHIPETKAAAIQRLGASLRRVPFTEWWSYLTAHRVPGESGVFIHPGADRTVMAGNGTIGLEILEDLPQVDAVVVPYGSGGLACGIAAALRAERPAASVYAAELAGRAPFQAALGAGRPVTIEYTANFVDGMGGTTVLAEMWPIARALLAGTRTATLAQVADAVRLIAERTRVIAEGAGAAPVAATLNNDIAARRIVCVVSGGNIDADKLATILGGGVP